MISLSRVSNQFALTLHLESTRNTISLSIKPLCSSVSHPSTELELSALGLHSLTSMSAEMSELVRTVEHDWLHLFRWRIFYFKK